VCLALPGLWSLLVLEKVTLYGQDITNVTLHLDLPEFPLLPLIS
jgi:hypothetical protein